MAAPNQIVSGTQIDQLDLGTGSTTTFSFLPGHTNVNLPKYSHPSFKLINLSDINVGGVTIDKNAKVYTPGATAQQQADLFNSFGEGNNDAVKKGTMGVNSAGEGLFAATQGLFNANAGVQSNVKPTLILLI